MYMYTKCKNVSHVSRAQRFTVALDQCNQSVSYKVRLGVPLTTAKSRILDI